MPSTATLGAYDITYTTPGALGICPGTETITISIQDKATLTQDFLVDQEGSTVTPINLEANSNVVSYLDFNENDEHFVNLNSLQGDLNGTSRSAFMWINTATATVSEPDFIFSINTSTAVSYTHLTLPTILLV